MEHPIPQNITSFEFHLVGDMTLKQFGYLAIGCVLAYFTFLILFSHSPFISIILMIGFALTGTMFAFIPISDRSLDHWVKAFFRAIYSPTTGWWQNPFAKKVKSNKNDPVFNNRLQNYLVAHNLEISPPKPVLFPQPRTTEPPTSNLPKLVRMAPKILSPQQPILQPAIPIPLPPKFEPSTPIVTIAEKPRMVQKSIQLTSLPNVVNGIVTDFSGNYIENVIVIIHNADGIPVRASKTNKLGQFSGATPLPAGLYNVTFEKEGLSFETLQVNLNNEIMPTLSIQPMKGVA